MSVIAAGASLSAEVMYRCAITGSLARRTTYRNHGIAELVVFVGTAGRSVGPINKGFLPIILHCEGPVMALHHVLVASAALREPYLLNSTAISIKG